MKFIWTLEFCKMLKRRIPVDNKEKKIQLLSSLTFPVWFYSSFTIVPPISTHNPSRFFMLFHNKEKKWIQTKWECKIDRRSGRGRSSGSQFKSKNLYLELHNSSETKIITNRQYNQERFSISHTYMCHTSQINIKITRFW